uniref:Uncharacterized protein n=1 Tax=Strigamia maritima TaxID=126957 RepID=T1JDC5_STRMM
MCDSKQTLWNSKSYALIHFLFSKRNMSKYELTVEMEKMRSAICQSAYESCKLDKENYESFPTLQRTSINTLAISFWEKDDVKQQISNYFQPQYEAYTENQETLEIGAKLNTKYENEWNKSIYLKC